MVRVSECIFAKFFAILWPLGMCFVAQKHSFLVENTLHKIMYPEFVDDDVIWDAARSISIAYKPANK